MNDICLVQKEIVPFHGKEFYWKPQPKFVLKDELALGKASFDVKQLPLMVTRNIIEVLPFSLHSEVLPFTDLPFSFTQNEHPLGKRLRAGSYKRWIRKS